MKRQTERCVSSLLSLACRRHILLVEPAGLAQQKFFIGRREVKPLARLVDEFWGPGSLFRQPGDRTSQSFAFRPKRWWRHRDLGLASCYTVR